MDVANVLNINWRVAVVFAILAEFAGVKINV